MYLEKLSFRNDEKMDQMRITYYGKRQVIGISKIKPRETKMKKNNTISLFKEISLDRTLGTAQVDTGHSLSNTINTTANLRQH